MRVLGWALTILLLAGCGQARTDEGPKPLDASATRACAIFEDLMARFDTLPEDDLRSQMVDMWNDAQLSQTTGIRLSARELMAAVFGHLSSRIDSTVKDMRTACAGRASPYPTLESNDRRG
jgi:hypothetical protein